MAFTQISTDGIKNGTITGSDLATNIDLVDNQKIRLGAGNDLQLYHDGTNSYLENNTGSLLVQGGGQIIYLQAVDHEDGIRINPNGSVQLFFDGGGAKFETTSYGAKFTDNVLFNNPDTAGRNLTWEADNDSLHWEDNTKATFGGGNDLRIYHNSTASVIENTTGYLKLQSDQFALQNQAGDHDYITVPTANQGV